MATLEFVRHQHLRSEVQGAGVTWVDVRERPSIDGLPQVAWATQEPWREANLWALEQATSARKNIKTVISTMSAIHAYAKWLESTGTNWWHFPAREADRCLVRYRGALIEAMEGGEIAPSTAAQRMAVVVRFYRWLAATRLLSPQWPMWRERQVGVRISDAFGFERTLQMHSTDLAIRNRARQGKRLEDGLLPVSAKSRDELTQFAFEHASDELALLLWLGFRTGMRIGTLMDLKIGTLDRAVADPLMTGWFRLAVGPGAHPPVATKFGVTGQVWIEGSDLAAVRSYFYSTRRLQRQALASAKDRDIVFLTRFGARYGNKNGDSSKALNVEVGRLRRAGVKAGLSFLHSFHFHQSRVTFATELARLVLKHGGPGLAIRVVKDALLHRDEATTLKYIRFVEDGAAMAEAADAFSRSFLGLVEGRNAHG